MQACRATPLTASEESILKQAVAEVLAPTGVTLSLISIAAPYMTDFRRRLQVGSPKHLSSALPLALAEAMLP